MAWLYRCVRILPVSYSCSHAILCPANLLRWRCFDVSTSCSGSITYAVMVSLGEMISYLPIPGGHIKLAERFVNPAFSFVMGWNYWYNWYVSHLFHFHGFAISANQLQLACRRAINPINRRPASSIYVTHDRCAIFLFYSCRQLSLKRYSRRSEHNPIDWDLLISGTSTLTPRRAAGGDGLPHHQTVFKLKA